MNEYILSTVATALLSGGLVQLLNLRSMKRIKQSEANKNEIENLRSIIDMQQGEINRLSKCNAELEKKYFELQDEFIAISEEIRNKKTKRPKTAKANNTDTNQ